MEIERSMRFRIKAEITTVWKCMIFFVIWNLNNIDDYAFYMFVISLCFKFLTGCKILMCYNIVTIMNFTIKTSAKYYV